jgi:hypothetical protein
MSVVPCSLSKNEEAEGRGADKPGPRLRLQLRDDETLAGESQSGESQNARSPCE